MGKTELASKTNTGFLIIGLMVLTLIGFYPTYISKFPEFEDITNLHHFHGAMMMLWFFLLIVQPFLIRYNKYEIHRAVGKASYVVAPLVLLSIFLTSRDEYFRDASRMTESEAMGGLALDMTSIAAFGVCYGLAIWHRHFTPYHKRYMIGTAIIIMAPGVIRALIIYELLGDWDFLTQVLFTSGISIAITGALIGYDIRRGYPYKPYLVVTGLIAGLTLVYYYRMSDWFQAIAKVIAMTF